RVPRWLAAAVRHPPSRLGRPVRGAVQDGADDLPVHLGAGHLAAPALRPADELRLEDPATAGNPQCARYGRARGGDARVTLVPHPTLRLLSEASTKWTASSLPCRRRP